MIPYPHPHNEHHHNENIKEWWAHETTKYLEDRLLNLVVKTRWNRDVVCRMIQNNELSSNDLEIHQHRMDRFMLELEHIEKQMRMIGLRYNPQRLSIIKQSIKKIKQYENKRIS